MNIRDAITGRRSIEQFKPDRPADEIIHGAIDCARYSPNHHLTQPWHFYHLGPESIDTIIDINCDIIAESRGDTAALMKRKRWATIPGWIVVTCDVSDREPLRSEDYAACCCAINSLQLILWGENIGTKWTTGEVTRHERFYDALAIDSLAEMVVGLVWYGYIDSMPKDKPRKPLSEILIVRE